MKNLLYFLCFSMLLASCGPDESDDDIGNNQSTGDYYPTAINNSWIFGTGASASLASIISTDVFNGKTYYKMNSYSGTTQSGANVISSNWIYKNNGDYILRLGVQASNFAYTASLSQPVEVTILKDYLNPGETWSQTVNYEYVYTPTSSIYPPVPNVTVNATYAYELVNRDLTLVVGGQTFNNVLEVELTYSDLVSGSTIVTTSYYAKDVGIIRNVSNGQNSDLASYTLY